MAERRMFSKAVVQSGRFVQMPGSAQALYFQLGMCADDDGAVEAIPVMRLISAAEDDLRLLVAKGYVKILNSDFALYIMDWSRNNTIRQDRYHASFYHDLIVRVMDSEGNAVMVDGWLTDGCQMGDKRLPEVSIGKDSIGKDNKEKDRSNADCENASDDGFETFWKAYPKKVGKAEARKSWIRLKPDREQQKHMMDTLEQAKDSDQWKRDGGKYIPNPSTWLNQGRYDDDVSTYARNVKTVNTSFHNMDSRQDDDLEAWAMRKQLKELASLDGEGPE